LPMISARPMPRGRFGNGGLHLSLTVRTSLRVSVVAARSDEQQTLMSAHVIFVHDDPDFIEKLRERYGRQGIKVAYSGSRWGVARP
jgi:hypothetical protein